MGEFIATRLSLIPSVKGRKRTVVITNGADDTIVCVNGTCTKHPIVKLAKEKLVDTNGAGDSYVGAARLAPTPRPSLCSRAAAPSQGSQTTSSEHDGVFHQWRQPRYVGSELRQFLSSFNT